MCLFLKWPENFMCKIMGSPGLPLFVYFNVTFLGTNNCLGIKLLLDNLRDLSMISFNLHIYIKADQIVLLCSIDCRPFGK